MMDGRGKIGEIGGADVDSSYRIRFSDRDLLKPKSDAPLLGITYVAAEVGAKAAQGREMEAEAIARLLKEWKSSGQIQSWKEVAVLLRAMTNVEIYIAALEAHDIPVYVVQGAAFYQKSEVSDLIAFLELVLHPQDELLRAIVLTSSLFGVPIGALGQWGQPKGAGAIEDDSGTDNEIKKRISMSVPRLLRPSSGISHRVWGTRYHKKNQFDVRILPCPPLPSRGPLKSRIGVWSRFATRRPVS
jgi:hypothetical protein